MPSIERRLTIGAWKGNPLFDRQLVILGNFFPDSEYAMCHADTSFLHQISPGVSFTRETQNHLKLLVPDDFPHPTQILASETGAAPKLLLVKDRERYVPSGQTKAEVRQRWLVCEDLATQLAEAARNSKMGKRANMNEIDILAQYLLRLISKKWAEPAECRWIVRRTASLLNWPVPDVALE